MPRPRPVLLVLLTCFFFSLTVGAVNYSIIFYLKDLFHADKGLIGLTAAGQTLTQMTFMLLLMRWKAAPFRGLVLAALGWGPVCMAVYLLVPVLGVTMLFHGLFGFSMALFWPRAAGWLSAGREGADLGRIMGRFNLAWSTGGLAAPTLGGLLLGVDLRLPFLAASGVIAVLWVLILVRLKPEEPSAATAGAGAGAAPAEAVPENRTPLRVPARLGMLSVNFLMGVLMNIYPAWARDSFHLNEALIGTFLMARMLLTTGGFLIWSRVTFWHFRRSAGPVSQAALLGLVLVFPFAGHPAAAAVLFAAAGLVYSFIYSYSQFHSTAGAADRNRATTIHEVVLNVGFIAGTAAGGWLAEAWSMTAAFGAAAVLTLAVAAFQTLWRPRPATSRAS